MNVLLICLAFIFGTIIGSFLNVVIWRIPSGQKLTGRSRCPACRKILGVLDLVPILSFIFLRGSCRRCGQKISPRYPLIEALTGSLFAWSAYYISPTGLLTFAVLARTDFILAILIVIFAIDFEHYLIFDSVLIFGGTGAILLNLMLDILSPARHGFWASGSVLAILSAGVCTLPFYLLWWASRGKWLGFGDVKLALFLGLALGWPLSFVGIFLGILLGGISGLLLLAWGNKTLKSKLPFGTFLSLAAAVTLFYGSVLLNWYLGFVGIGRLGF